MKTVHIVGDSHCVYAWDRIEIRGVRMKRHHLGAKLMHSLIEHGEALVRFRSLRIQPYDVLVTSFGEIDCRVHAHQHGIENLAERYLNKLIAMTDGMSLVVRCVMGVVPPQEDPNYLHVGSAQERLGYVRALNRDLRACALERGWKFLDVYHAYAAEDGFFRQDMVGYKGHIGDVGPLQALVEKVIYP